VKNYDTLKHLRDRVTANSGLDDMYNATEEYTTAHAFLYFATYQGIVDQMYFMKVQSYFLDDEMHPFLELADTLAMVG
jgi:hypothetical protein